MECELEYLIEKLENKVTKKENVYEVYEGKINNYPVVILKTEVGTINAAISLMLAVQKYSPIAIINEGTSGSHEYTYHKFDLVIGDSVININSIKTCVKQIGRGTTPLEWEIKEFHNATGELTEYNSDEKLLELAKEMEEEYKYGKLYVGKIGSGDIWNREVDRISWFNKKFKTCCEEMEAISIYKIANMFNIPVIAFKVISNNEILGEKFDKNWRSLSRIYI